MRRTDPLEVRVNNLHLTISIGIETLAKACEASLNLFLLEPKWKIDVIAFSRYMARQLQVEEEDGTTAIHRMLDQAANECLEQGEPGIEEVPT